MNKELELELMKDIQYRKELSIPYFNSLNNAVEIVISSAPKNLPIEKKIAMISDIKQRLLDEYKQYRVTIMDVHTKPLIDPSLKEGLDNARKIYEASSKKTL